MGFLLNPGTKTEVLAYPGARGTDNKLEVSEALTWPLLAERLSLQRSARFIYSGGQGRGDHTSQYGVQGHPALALYGTSQDGGADVTRWRPRSLGARSLWDVTRWRR